MVRKSDNRLRFWDIILIIGVISAPMTSLRIGKIGIAEVSIFIWCIKTLINSKFIIKNDDYILFFLLFDVALFLGFAFRKFKGVYTGYGTLEESITFLFFNIFIIALSQYLQKTKTEKLLKVLKNIFYWSFYIYFSLFLYSIFIKNSIAGKNLWYGERLSILADNPHQFVFLIGPVILVGLLLMDVNCINNKVQRIFAYFFILGFAVMGIQTKSSTLFATFFVIAIYILFFKSKTKNNIKRKFLMVGMKLSLFFTILISFYNIAYNFFIKFVEHDPNGLGRFILWQRGIRKIIENPIFGLGPGSHIYDINLMNFVEAHNTYIDIALRSGLIGLIFYITLLYKSIKITRINVYATSIILFFCLYGLAGYSIRRITFWFFIMSVTYIFKKN